jgi:tetratricopeptide (TPR) repeat protein
MGLELIEPGEPIPAEPSIAELEDRVLDDPDDPEAHRALGEALVAAGEPLRGQEELELALAGYESKEDWHHAAALVEELIRLDPNGVRYHQKQVEIAFRSGDRGRLLEAYLELADSLVRVGAVDKAVAVYRRVAEHDPENQRALAAISALSVAEEVGFAPGGAAHEALSPAGAGQPGAPPEAEGDTDESFVDLGALVLEDARPKDTRMRVEGEEPTGDEQRDFQDMLVQFRRGIEENIAAEDFQAHYDLGVAFKEMGLLDEAIAEFQKALRSPEVRLKTTEALGSAFFEKEQYAIAEAILRRGIESLGAADDEQIGLLYWLGRSQEAQGKFADALPNYERVLAVEIGFQDAGQRMSKLSAKRAR